jgi:cellulose synthase/poly-beta-1,6-N-acetylglucosamine synthase-like glycosyltransferase
MQAIALDKHFAMEQTVRHRADLFPKFNGSGGIWRRACLEDAGGWQSDTICEDLCLSTRAILRGWQFRFLADVVAPAELPNTMSAYKNQQARWAKGSLQCLIKYFWSILRDRNHSLVARVYAILTMLGYTTHFLVLTLLLLQLPMMLLNVELSPRLIFFSIAGLGQPVLFVLAQHVLYDDWLKRLRHFPATLIIAIGMGVSQCRAILEVVFGRIRPIKHPFVRTPKGEEGQTAYLLPFDRIIYVELLLAVYAFVGLIVAIYTGHFTSLVLLSACLLGFGYVGLQSLAERRR